MRQIFPIFNPVTGELAGYKERSLVHTDGDWHRGVQANILRKNAVGSFEILVQKRSAIVDIGMGKFDQSLATQMIDDDKLDDLKTLRRGLLTELGIQEYKSIRLDRDLRIVKTYEEQPNLLNRELISLFLVEAIGDKPVVAMTPKIEQLFWMPWNSFLDFFAEKMKDFTKTAQFFFGEPDLLRQIEAGSFRMLSSTSSTATEEQLHGNFPALVHVNKWTAEPKTYCGNIADALREAGELNTDSYNL